MNRFYELFYNVSKLSIHEKKVLITLLNKDINSERNDLEKEISLKKNHEKLIKEINEKNNFWRNKLYQTYPFCYDLHSEFQNDDFKKLYSDIETLLKKINLEPVEMIEAGFRRPFYVTQELADFFLHADLGFVSETEVPLNYILWPLLKDRIISKTLASKLFFIYIKKYEFKENDRKYYKAGPEMEKYLRKYLTELEIEDIKEPSFNKYLTDSEDMKRNKEFFNRNKFLFNRTNVLLEKGFIPRSSLTEEQNINLEKYTSILRDVESIIQIY